MNDYEKQQALQALINRYGMDYLDHLDYWELEEMIEEVERYG